MPGSHHEADSEIPTRDHDDCVSFQEFRALNATVKAMAADLKAVREALMVSTPDRGCVIDTQRKHESQIQELQAERGKSFARRIWETAVMTATSTITVLGIALLGKGIVVAILSEAVRLAGGAK